MSEDASQYYVSRRSWLRPSALPKLALCGHYRSEPGNSTATDRGNALDEEFRDSIAETEDDFAEDAEKEQAMRSELRAAEARFSPPVQWAFNTAYALAGMHPLESSEERLRVEALGLTGTADLLCEAGGWSADLKSGQIRNYMEQQALYALGFMESFFADEWTVYLLYCDLEVVEALRFTYTEATAIVKNVLAKVLDAENGAPPEPNEYCGWCASRFDCPARKEQLGLILERESLMERFESLPSALLRDFAKTAKTVEEYAVRARQILLERSVKGESIPGVSVTNRSGSVVVPENVVELHLRELGSSDVLTAYGPMSEKKFAEIWARKMGGRPMPREKFIQKPGSSYITIRKPKAALK